MARPEEFRTLPQARAASDCWFDWLRAEITPHDGAVRPDHPLIHAILERTQSASSLRMLLRNPLGFVWHYGLGWRAPESGDDPLTLDALAMGNLVHRTLERALRTLEADGGLASASEQRIAAAVDGAAAEVARKWESDQAVPPPDDLAQDARRGARAGQPGARLPRRGPRRRACLWRGPLRRDGAQVRWGDPVGCGGGRRNSRYRLPHQGPHRPAGCLRPTAAAPWCATTRLAGCQRTTSSSTGAGSCSAASMPSPSRRCWATRWLSKRRSSIRARSGTCGSKTLMPRSERLPAICRPPAPISHPAAR